jgi:CHAT domain-containing protein
MKLTKIVFATIITLSSWFSISLPISAQEDSFTQEDSYINIPEGLTDPQLKKAFSSVDKIEMLFGGDYLLDINRKEKQGILEILQKAEVVLREREQKTDKSQKIYELSLWDKICLSYKSIQAWKNAVEACEHSFDLKTEKRLPSNAEEAMTWLNSQDIYLYIYAGEYDKAIKQLNKSLEIGKKFSLISFSEVAGAYLALGKYNEAVKYYRLNLDSVEKEHNKALTSESDISSARGVLSEAKHLLGLALLKNNNLPEAEEKLLQAMEGYEKNNKEAFSHNLDARDLYEIVVTDDFIYSNLQELRVKQGRYEEALELSERGRTHILAKQMSQNNNLPKLSISQMQVIAKQQNATLVEYFIIKERVGFQAKDDRIFIWVVKPNGSIHFRPVELNLAKQKSFLDLNIFNILPLEAIISIIGGGLAGFFLFIKKRTKLAVIATLATLSINFYLSSSQSQLIPINLKINSSDNISLSDLVRNTLITVKGEAQGSFSESLNSQICQNSEECLKQLHQLLIKPIEEFLPSNQEEQVVFIPGDLSQVPFAALQDNQGKYLIEKHTISTTPSIRILQLLAQRQLTRQKSNPTTKALVVGNPLITSKVKVDVDVPNANNKYVTLSDLPGAAKEAKAVASLLNTEAIIGEQATESLVVQKMPQAKIIHFATHAVLEIGGDMGGLLLTPSPSSKTCLDNIQEGRILNQQELDCLKRHQNDSLLKNDGFLFIEEISSLNLNAELVVMSACETGLGHNTHDGVVGLVRPFLTRGVPTVIASLWTIPDAPTSELMVDFYKNLQANPNKAQALRQAMLTTMKKHPKPFNWAAFTLVGEAK